MIKQWEAGWRVLWHEAETLSLPGKRKVAELNDDVAQQAPNEAQSMVFISEHVVKSAASKIPPFFFFKPLLSLRAKSCVPFGRFITQQQKNICFSNWLK